MLRLRSSVDAERAGHFGDLLRELEGVRRVVQQPDRASAANATVFVADVEAGAADELVEAIAALEIPVEDYVLAKVDVVAPLRRFSPGLPCGLINWMAIMAMMTSARSFDMPPLTSIMDGCQSAPCAHSREKLTPVV